MSPDASAVRWTLASERALIEGFDGEAVVFNRSSGETHFLNATAAAILDLLARNPSTPAEIERGIRARFDADSVTNLVQNIDRVLHEFQYAGLICPD